jgi:hypothetical protein
MEEMKEEKKEEKRILKKKAPQKKFSKEEKIKAIKSSKMPDSQKQAYISELEGEKVEKKGVPYAVYAKVKGIPSDMQKAMLAFPKAKGIEVATLKQWDEIFKDF